MKKWLIWGILNNKGQLMSIDAGELDVGVCMWSSSSRIRPVYGGPLLKTQKRRPRGRNNTIADFLWFRSLVDKERKWSYYYRRGWRCVVLEVRRAPHEPKPKT